MFYRIINIFLICILISPLAIGHNKNIAQNESKESCIRVVKFIKKLQVAIKNNDKKTIADACIYPLPIYTGDFNHYLNPYLIYDEKEFIKKYNRILSPQMRRDFLATIKQFTSCNSFNSDDLFGQGFKIGGGILLQCLDFKVSSTTSYCKKIAIGRILYDGKNPLRINKSKFGKIINPINDVSQLRQFILCTRQ